MFQAQVIRLFNEGHPDEEVILYSDTFADIVEILENPVQRISDIGKKFGDESWTLLEPVTAFLRPHLESERIHKEDTGHSDNDFRFDVGPSFEDFGDVRSMFGEGSFILQFAKKTHTMMVTYIPPSSKELRPDIVNTYSEVTAIVTEQADPKKQKRRGTVHFDLEQRDSIDLRRAVLVARHLIDPDLHCYSQLRDTPFESDPPSPVREGTIIVPKNPTKVRKFKYKQALNDDGKNNGVVIVEGLSKVRKLDDEVVVCLQAGAVLVACDTPNCTPQWVLNGVIVKNYTE